MQRRNIATMLVLNCFLLLLFAALAKAGASAPRIMSIVPNIAPAYGGSTVVINGRNFVNGAIVKFGSRTSASTTFVSSTQLNAVTPLSPKGVVDVVVTNPDGKSAILASGFEFYYSADGFFEWQKYNLPPDINSSRDAEVGDLNGDGHLDIFIANKGEQNRLYLNDRNGKFTNMTSTNLPVDSDTSNGATLGDFDNDSDLDIFIANENCPNKLYLNNGTGYFTDVTQDKLPPDIDRSINAAFGDVNKDGHLDILVANYGQNRLYLNDGAGRYADFTSTNMPIESNLKLSYTAELVDVNNDGNLDAIIGNNGQNSLYLNDGTGHFTDVSAAYFPQIAGESNDIDCGDVNNDGFVDVFVTNINSMCRLYLNDGAGHFTDVTTNNFPTGLSGGNSSAVADVNGDSYPDILIVKDNRQNSLYLNDGTGHFVDATATNLMAELNSCVDVELFDADRDGDKDAVIAVFGQNRLYRNEGNGVFTDITVSTLPPPIEYPNSAVFGDVDKDEDIDIIIANCGQNRIYLNNGMGTFADATATRLPPNIGCSNDVVLGDVDKDGDLDIAFANYFVNGTYGQQNTLYFNDGTGHFADGTMTHLPQDTDYSLSVRLGDIDKDGDLDMFFANNGQDRLYLNDNTGHFTDITATNLPPDSDNSNSGAFGDFDKNGTLDIFIANFASQNRLYFNDGTGHFSNVTSTHLPPESYYSVKSSVGDVDGDNDLDLVFTNEVQQTRIYLNDGIGHFTDATAINLPAVTRCRDINLGDVDGDGDQDLFISNLQFGWRNHLYLNSGNGIFIDASFTNLPNDWDQSNIGIFGDVDKDGDLDVFTGARIYTNVKVPDTLAPTIPNGLTATAVSSNQIDLIWQSSTDNVGVAGYAVFRNGTKIGTSPTTSYADNGLTENTSYCYTVEAFDAAGNYSAPSSTVCATTPLAPRLRVDAITMKARIVKTTEYLDSTVVITTPADTLVPQAVVTGQLTLPSGNNVPYSGSTDTMGKVTFSYSVRNKSLPTGTYTFVVFSVSKSGYIYDPSQNRMSSATFKK